MASKQAVEAQIETIALLGEPVRRALYLHLVSQRAEIGRDEAARAVGVSRSLAAFHLDRLVAAGLLEPVYRRLSGRSGPGAGRPDKLYRPSGRQLEVSLPRRQYHLAARILARALGQRSPRHAAADLRRAAREFGLGIGREARRLAGSRPSESRLRAAVVEMLVDYGFEPCQTEPGVIRLLNCPFEALAQEYRPLVCGMNLACMEAISAGAGARSLKAQPDPTPGRCCVALQTAQK